LNFTEEQKNFILELVHKEIEANMNIRTFDGGVYRTSRFKQRELRKFDTATSAAFKRFAEKIKKEL